MHYRTPVRMLSALTGVFFGMAPAYAGAWLQQKGHGVLIVNAPLYRADEFLDNGGRRQSQQTFTKAEINPYLEYGLTDEWTIGASLFLPFGTQEDAAGDMQHNIALGDSEWYARTALWQNDRAVISIKPFIKLPGIDDSRDRPVLVSTHADAGLALSGGYGFTLLGLPAYTDTEVAYRYRLGDVHDQLQLAATLGVQASQRLLVLPQLFATWRMDHNAASGFTNSPQDDYSLIKLQLSGVYQWDEDYSFQAGGFFTADGRNTGAGEGILLSVWRRF